MTSGEIRSIFGTIKLVDEVSRPLRQVNQAMDAAKRQIDAVAKVAKDAQTKYIYTSQAFEQSLATTRYFFAQMDLASREAIIRAKHASKPVQEMAIAFERAKMKVRDYAETLKSKLADISDRIEHHKELILGVGAALSAFAYGGFRFFKEGTKDLVDFQDAMQVFRIRAGENADAIIKAMEEAAGGTIDSTQLILNANRAMVMGIDPEYLPKMMEIARAAARNMGTDVQYMFESIVLGTARQSKLILDNLGIIVKTDEAYDKYAKTLGKTASQLTEAEKRQAFINAVMEAGEDIVKHTYLSQRSLNEEIQRATVAWMEFKKSLAEGALPVISRFIDGIITLTSWLRDLPKPVKAVIGTLGVMVTGVSAVVGPLMLQAAAFAYLSSHVASFGSLTAVITSFKTAILGLASSTLAALAPLLPAILAISAAILILQHAWVHNWGGIREATAKVVEGLRWAFGGLISLIKTFISGFVEPFRFLFSPILEALGLFNKEAEGSKLLVSIVDAISGAFRWLYSILEPHIPLIKQIVKVVGTLAAVFFLISNPIGQAILLISGITLAVRAAIPWIQSAIDRLGPLKYALLGPAGAILILAQNFDRLQSIASSALTTLRAVWDNTIGWIIAKISEFISVIQRAWKTISENPIFEAAKTVMRFTPVGAGITAAKTTYAAITEHRVTIPELPKLPSITPVTSHSPTYITEHRTIHVPKIEIKIDGVKDPDRVAEIVKRSLRDELRTYGY